MIKRFLARLFDRAVEKVIDAITEGDYKTACKIADSVLDVAEEIAERTKTPKDDEIVAQFREFHTVICGEGYEDDELETETE